MSPVVSHRFWVGSNPSISASVPMTRLPPILGVPADEDPVPLDDPPDAVAEPPVEDLDPPLQAAATRPTTSTTVPTRVPTRMLPPCCLAGAISGPLPPTVPLTP